MTSSRGSLSKTPRAKPAVVQAIFVQQASTICVIPSRGAITIQIYPTQIPMSYRMKSSSKSFLHFEQGKELLFPRQRKRGGESRALQRSADNIFPDIQRSIKPRRSHQQTTERQYKADSWKRKHAIDVFWISENYGPARPSKGVYIAGFVICTNS